MANKKSTKAKAASKPKAQKKEVKEKSKQLITKDMLIGELAAKYPEAVEVMFKRGMHCIGCSMTAYESLEQGCIGHGLSSDDVDKMVDEMNKLLAKKAKR